MIQPFGKFVVIRAQPVEMRGSFHMVESDDEKAGTGTVLAVGPYVEFVRPDDLVIFHKYSPETFEHDNEILLVLKESEIMAKKPV